MADVSIVKTPSATMSPFEMDNDPLQDKETVEKLGSGTLCDVPARLSFSQGEEKAEARDDISATAPQENDALVLTDSRIENDARSVASTSSATTSAVSSDPSSDSSDSDSDTSESESRGMDPSGTPPTGEELISTYTSDSESRGADKSGTTPTGGEMHTSDSETRASNSKRPVGNVQNAEDDSAEVNTALPPLAPRRVNSNASGILRRSLQKSVPSFFLRSRSNPTKLENDVSTKTKASPQTVLKDTQDDHKEAPTRTSSGVSLSVHSGSRADESAKDTINSDHSLGPVSVIKSIDSLGPDSVGLNKSFSRETEESLIGIKFGISDDAGSTVYGVAKNASADASLSGAVSATSSELQDPWPNPWSASSNPEATENQNLSLPPHDTSPNKVPVSVLDSVAGVVLSSSPGKSPKDMSEVLLKAISEQVRKDAQGGLEEAGMAKASSEQKPEVTEETRTSENQFEVLVKSNVEEVTLDTQVEETRQSDPSDDLFPQSDSAICELNTERGEANDWKELLADEAAKPEEDHNHAKQTKNEAKQGGKNKAQKPSSLWERTKSMLRAKQAKRGRGSRTKAEKVRKVKLGCLFRLNSCTKLSTIKEIEEKAAMKSASPAVRLVTPTSDDMTEEECCEDLNNKANISDIENYVVVLADGPATEVVSEQTVAIAPTPKINSFAEPSGTTILGDTSKNALNVASVDPAIEKSKSGANNVPSYTPPKNAARSWLDELPSMESMLGREPHDRTFSEEASSYADISKVDSDVAGRSPINHVNSFVAAATMAVQHNFYDVPRRELEKLKELACLGQPKAEHESLFDKDLTATESHDSIYAAPTTQQGKERTKSKNPFAMIFSELVEVLECSCGDVPKQPPTKRFEEEKPTERDEGSGSNRDLVF